MVLVIIILLFVKYQRCVILQPKYLLIWPLLFLPFFAEGYS